MVGPLLLSTSLGHEHKGKPFLAAAWFGHFGLVFGRYIA
jgi:hypothetical protein